MRTIIFICVAALALSACDAKPLRTREEAATEAAADTLREVASSTQTTIEGSEMAQAKSEFNSISDPVTGCEYVYTNRGLTPRMVYSGRRGPQYFYRQLGCTEQ